MFSKLALITSLAVLAVATPAPAASQCDTGSAQCCQSVQSSSTSAVAALLQSIGVVVQGVDVPIGITCSPITVVGGSGTCDAAPVCCENNNFSNCPMVLSRSAALQSPSVFEREVANVVFVVIAYAWCSLGTFLSVLARKEFDESATPQEIFSGRYIEAGPTIICALFLFIGTSISLYGRARIGQGPYVIAPTFACIVMDITLTVAHFYPYASYQIGQSCILSFIFHSAVAIACSVFIFPETINAQFIKRYHAVFVHLGKAMRTQLDLFAVSSISDGLNPDLFIKLVAQAESALAPLTASSRMMKKDLSWSRFGYKDFSRLHELARHMTPGMPALSLLNTPWSTPSHSRPPTRPPSPSTLNGEGNAPPRKVSIKPTTRSHPQRHHGHQHHFFHNSLPRHHVHHYHSQHNSERTPSISLRTSENVVGVFESQRYLNLESRYAHPSADELFPLIMHSLGESTRELVICCAETLDHVMAWLQHLNEARFWKLYGRKRGKGWKEALYEDEIAKETLQRVLDEFWGKKRHLVLDLYRATVDPDNTDPSSGGGPPPHLFLFQSYMYQYHLMRFAKQLCQILDEMIQLEKTRHRSRLWLPVLPLRKIIIWSKWEFVDKSLQHGEDEDPNIIQGIDPETQGFLEVPTMRDPDALPASTTLQAAGNIIYHALSALGHGNAVFGLKAGILSINRSVWALIYGQLTLSRFRGDTTFALFSRILSTFLGGLLGTVMWYISTGLGDGNSYGMAAVTAVCFPILFFIRYYFPASALTLTIFLMTAGLVIGYSWQDTHDPTLSNAGRGIQVAWKRFVLVTIGVTVAFTLSFLPPATTLRRYLRATCATTAEQIGYLYCDIISYATVPDGPHKEIIIKDLFAIRMKLRRSLALMQNVTYEFSLRGKWPEKRYNTIYEIQMEIAYLLSHLRSVTEHLELSWAKAFLKRTRFLEPEFQGDVLGVISMISFALRTGKPLPQVTSCPLLDRFVALHHGLNVFRMDDETDFGLPHTLTIETLEDEQYLYFSVGVATAFGIVTRLDRLMIATKELVGEQYHIRGLPLHTPKSKGVH
ncbi:hypothetical protein EW145_g5635 [Phellinidium pouzarii]|uniref:DUF2421 domain-containing protein n=1 Tax=Phellinidium pouzarii TaxID=167371 RepID=A0A4S4KZJ6_9AGAM|nr:hypothetical protein EW145_g5635 [Phellinidium pouzarii]